MAATALPSADLILHPQWLLPIAPHNRLLERCSVAIKDGVICALAPRAQIESQWQAKQVIELPQQVLMPGLVNCHNHAAMSLLSGFADDLPLMTWLNDHIWPAEGQWVDEEFVTDGTTRSIAEMLLSGTTCFSDMYFFPEAAARVVNETGIRAQITFPLLDFPNRWAADIDEGLRKGLSLFDDYKDHPRISIGFGPHAPYTLGDSSLRRIAILANEVQAPVHIHVHETAQEVADSMAQYGQRPLARLLELGLLSPQTQCVHMTQINDEDLRLLQETGAKVIHCPESNLKLASGFCPADKLLKAGIEVGLGTDGAASNNNVDMFGELHTTALLAKAVAGDAAALAAEEALYMATLGGAKTLGLDSQIGSLEVGKQADMIALSLDPLLSTPSYSLVSNLVYRPGSHRVNHLWVSGKALVSEGALQGLDSSQISRTTARWQQQIRGALFRPA
ncbi:MAG TPA: TRZ/ATZ family hydrolase, partial [Cellvibrionaceae bacterium]|nr:TRZ/ATZ family hydrolase [Cellvibrionaceae bacterium]